MKKEILIVTSVLGLSLVNVSPANADILRAELTGFDEVENALSTPATGAFIARLNREETEIQYQLAYSGFPTAVTQAHLHFNKRALNGPVIIFLCSNLGNGPAGTQACPTSAGVITGVLRAADVLGGAAAFGIAAGEFAEVVRAIRHGAVYVNVHTQAFPGGEIRDQVEARGFRDHDD